MKCEGLLLVLTVAFSVAGVKEHPANLLLSYEAGTDSSLAWRRYPIEGFAWPSSVLPGDTVRFYVSVMARDADSAYDIDFYRIPDIDVNPIRPRIHIDIGHFFPLRDSLLQPILPGDTSRKPIDFRLGCKDYWADGAVAFPVPSDWKSGVYVARLTHERVTDWDSLYYLPFVVRSLTPGDSTKILLKFELNTMQAYNSWGGSSLYSDIDGTLTPTDTVALDRPLRLDFDQSMRYVLTDFVKLLIDSGYTMEYCNNIDLDRRGPGYGIDLLSRYKTVVLWNHDEYWSTSERNNIEQFKGPIYHGNIARFAPNTCYWRIHWEGDVDGPHNRFVCYKNNWPGPPWREPVDMWRYKGSGGAGRPEAEFLGSQYQDGYNIDNPADSVIKPGHWIFKDTNLAPGDTFGYGIIANGVRKGIVSGEIDNTVTGRADFPLDTLAERAVWSVVTGGEGYLRHQMIYYEDTKTNARVFASGAGSWWLGIAYNAIDDSDRIRMQTITMNIISHFSGNKYLGEVHTDTGSAVVWEDSVELDGNTYIGAAKGLRLSSTKVIIDSGVTFFIDGRLVVEGTASILGSGQINLWHNGKINLTPGAVLQIGPGVVLDIEDSGDVAFDTGTKLEIQGTVLALTRSNLTVEEGGVLEMHAGAQAYFGASAQVTCRGRMECSGTESKPVIFSAMEQSPPPGAWYGIILNGGPNTLSHCLIQYAADGVDVKNTSVNLIDHCTITDCSTNGILGYQTAPSDSALRIRNTTLTRNSRGVALSSARAIVDSCVITANRWQGVYQPTSVCHITNTRIEENGYAGILVSGASSEVVLGSPDHGPGHVTVYNNNAVHGASNDEISLSTGGTATIGFDDDELKHWGYNNIYRGPNASRYLVANSSGPVVMAHLTYWGPDGPQPGDFLGTVDYSFWLTSPAKEAEKSTENRQMMQPGSEAASAQTFVSRLMGMVERGTDSSFFALHALATMVGPGGKSAKLLPQGWETYLQETGSAAREEWLQNLCHAFRLQARLWRRDFPGTMTYADSLLRTNPPDNLWLLCELDKINALVGMGRKEEAVRLLGTIQERGRRVDADAIQLTDEILKGR
jgi:hypothetical protein